MRRRGVLRAGCCVWRAHARGAAQANTVGAVIKANGDVDPLGVLTVLPVERHRQAPAVQQAFTVTGLGANISSANAAAASITAFGAARPYTAGGPDATLALLQEAGVVASVALGAPPLVTVVAVLQIQATTGASASAAADALQAAAAPGGVLGAVVAARANATTALLSPPAVQLLPPPSPPYPPLPAVPPPPFIPVDYNAASGKDDVIAGCAAAGAALAVFALAYIWSRVRSASREVDHQHVRDDPAASRSEHATVGPQETCSVPPCSHARTGHGVPAFGRHGSACAKGGGSGRSPAGGGSADGLLWTRSASEGRGRGGRGAAACGKRSSGQGRQRCRCQARDAAPVLLQHQKAGHAERLRLRHAGPGGTRDGMRQRVRPATRDCALCPRLRACGVSLSPWWMRRRTAG